MSREVTELLQAARESSGMTLEQLQHATGIDAAQLSKLLKADGNPTLSTLQRVAGEPAEALATVTNQKRQLKRIRCPMNRLMYCQLHA